MLYFLPQRPQGNVRTNATRDHLERIVARRSASPAVLGRGRMRPAARGMERYSFGWRRALDLTSGLTTERGHSPRETRAISSAAIRLSAT